ncbi:MAG TPA: hypothetical protein VGV65_05400, partial [Nocardioides sp.]|nr:hypothetical protein [Nocardioides sp.]
PGRLPTGLPAESAATVSEGVTAAPAAGAGAPDLAGQVLAAAASAFTDAYKVGGLIGGLALIATAVLAHGVLAQRRAPEIVEDDALETTAA